MSTPSPRVIRVERPDDLPVLLASLRRLQVAELLDRHFPTGHRCQRQLPGAAVLRCCPAPPPAQAPPRLYHVQPWAEEHHRTLQASLGKAVRPLDFHDDRLADVLDHLAHDGPWQAFEADL